MLSMRAGSMSNRFSKTRLHYADSKGQWRHIQRRITTRPESTARNQLAWKQDWQLSGEYEVTITTKHMREKQRVPAHSCELHDVVVVNHLENHCCDNAIKAIWVFDQAGHSETIAMRVSQSCKKHGDVLQRLLDVSREHSRTREAAIAQHVHGDLHFEHKLLQRTYANHDAS